MFHRPVYFHFRLPAGSVIQDEPGKVSCRGGVTICFVPEEDDYMSVGIAVCSPLDPYNKKIGRQIALGRALKYNRRYGISAELSIKKLRLRARFLANKGIAKAMEKHGYAFRCLIG